MTERTLEEQARELVTSRYDWPRGVLEVISKQIADFALAHAERETAALRERAEHAESFCYQAAKATGGREFVCAETVPLRSKIAAIDKAVSDAGAPLLTGDDATIVDRINGLGRDVSRLHREKCDALDELAALRARLERIETAAQSRAAIDVIHERERQIRGEGWTSDHDDLHRFGELAGAAACYAVHDLPHWAGYTATITFWPWDKSWWKPSDRRHNLVKAGALILAEIERLDRRALRDALGGEQ